MDFKEKVIEIIKEYGAPEDISRELKDFLIESGNVYSIIQAYKELIEKEL